MPNLYVCMQTHSTCYTGTKKMDVKGILWHSTGANNPTLKRYVQPYEGDPNYDKDIAKLGKNTGKNDWNHIYKEAGLNAWIGKFADGSIGTVQTMPWNYRPWGCGSGSKGSCNNGWIQFEICEDALTDKNYAQAVWNEAIELSVYLCKMFNLNPLGTVLYGGVQCPVITCHNDAAKIGLAGNHADINHWFPKILGKNMADACKEIAAKMNNSEEVKNNVQGTDFVNMNNAEFISTLGPLCTEDQKKSGILASVTMAQAIVESSWGKSDLAQGANNLFGMKTSLSGNSWPNSAWDGKSKFTKVTKEEYKEGVLTPVVADFRSYKDVESSIADHSAYLSGAKKGSVLRYEGLKGCTDYKTAIQIIKDGGYATSSTYVNTICNVIEKNNLTQFDLKDSTPVTPTTAPTKNELYRVRKSWKDAKSQIGAYSILENAKAACKEGYTVYDSKGRVIYTCESKKSIDEIVKEIIDGKLGNGDERKKKLTDAGYDYTEVQSAVNRKLSIAVKHVKAVSGLWLHNRATTSTSTRIICIPYNTEFAVKSVSGSMSYGACVINNVAYTGYVASSYLG